MTPSKTGMVFLSARMTSPAHGLRILTATGFAPCHQEKQRRSDMLISQPTAKPTRKVTAAGIGGAIATIAIWVAQEFGGITVPPFVGTAAGGLLAAVFGYFARERKL